LKERERDDRDDEIARLKSKVGEITMDNELLYAKIGAMEGKPYRYRRGLLQCMSPLLAVRPENHQWRKIPPGELSIDPVADERLGRVTGRAGAS
jgi:hypothetical protein